MKKVKTINLSYASSFEEQPYSNFGDSLSAIVVALLSGSEILHSDFDSDSERLAAIGTIAHELDGGTVHLWGTGLDVKVSRVPGKRYFDARDMKTKFIVHALRGKISEHAFSSIGLMARRVYGDPAILLSKLLKSFVGEEKNGKVGIVCHLSDLDNYSSDSLPNPSYKRYFSDDPRLKFISPITKPDPYSVIQKVKEIASCSYVLSSSLHGLVIADAFQVPSVFISPAEGITGVYNIFDYEVDLDHRFRDYRSGVEDLVMPVFSAPKENVLNVDEVIGFINSNWSGNERIERVSDRLVDSFPYQVNGYKDHLILPENFFSLKV